MHSLKNKLLSQLALCEKMEIFWIELQSIFEDNVEAHGISKKV